MVYSILRGWVKNLQVELVVVLAQDVKVLLQSVRRTRRSWRYIGKQVERKWPTRADNYPRILEMLQIIDDAIGDDSQETAVVPEDDTAAERDESGEIMDAWGIQPPQQPESIEEKLQAKRKAVLLDLQDKQVQIEDSDEAPEGLQGLPL